MLYMKHIASGLVGLLVAQIFIEVMNRTLLNLILLLYRNHAAERVYINSMIAVEREYINNMIAKIEGVGF